MNRFYDKTNNSWDDRNSFVKVPGKYDMVAMDYGSEVVCVCTCVCVHCCGCYGTSVSRQTDAGGRELRTQLAVQVQFL